MRKNKLSFCGEDTDTVAELEADKPLKSRLHGFETKPLKSSRLVFCGLQRMVGAATDTWMALWNIEEHGTDFPFHSTVSEKSLRLAGYFCPNPTGYKAGELFNSAE